MNLTTRRFLAPLLVVAFAVSLVFAQKTVHVKTYTRKDGTVVQAHNRAAPGTANRVPSSSSNRSPSAENTSIYTAPVHVSSTRPRSATIERDSNGKIKRSASAKHEFMVLHPCPVTGSTSGSCHGYVIDHITPLACGGMDSPSNMQWQTVEAAKAKDKWERKGCR